MTFLHLMGPGIDQVMLSGSQTDNVYRTDFGTFRKSDMTWICDRRFKVEEIKAEDVTAMLTARAKEN